MPRLFTAAKRSNELVYYGKTSALTYPKRNFRRTNSAISQTVYSNNKNIYNIGLLLLIVINNTIRMQKLTTECRLSTLTQSLYYFKNSTKLTAAKRPYPLIAGSFVC